MPASICQHRCPKATRRAPKAGTEVKFCGLFGRKHLNGLTGTVIPHLNGTLEDETHRCRVQVHYSSQTVKVLARNITEVTPESRWEIADRIETIEPLAEDHLVLPTTINLHADRGCKVPEEKPPEEKFTNRICTCKGQQMLGETYAKYQKSAAGRDPGRLRHQGLDFFRDTLTEEAHPGNSKTRNCKTKDTWYHTMRSGYDWRGGGSAAYVDPFHIPVAQGGHAAHVGLGAAMNKDAAENELPLHPRLRGLLLDEELEAEEEFPPIDRGYRELILFTNENAFLKTKDVGGPVRRAMEKEREFKKRESNAIKHLKQRVALSVKPGDDSPSSLPPLEWSGRTIEIANPSVASPKALPQSTFEKEEAQWNAADYVQTPAGYIPSTKQGISPELLQAPPLSQSIAPSVLRMKSPEANDIMQKMLEKATQDAEQGFNYGDHAARKSAEIPWYDQQANVSSMLILDQNASLPSLASSDQLLGVSSITGNPDGSY